ncbi:MAG: hypothetical protein IT366_19535 [Candidatus Hydrogenedentes bacterium]|nr:hypothetical protein [Candidatus Hydrogenedentota bacterium]
MTKNGLDKECVRAWLAQKFIPGDRIDYFHRSSIRRAYYEAFGVTAKLDPEEVIDMFLDVYPKAKENNEHFFGYTETNYKLTN